MRNGCALVVGLLTAAPLLAQTLGPPVSPGPASAPIVASSTFNFQTPTFPEPNDADRRGITDPVLAEFAQRMNSTDPPGLWLRIEYLTWWVKNAPLPISLLTTGNTNNPGGELLASDRRHGAFAGGRFGLGGWLDRYNNVGLDGNIFFLGQRTNNFFTASDNRGNPTLAFPFFSQTPGQVGERVMPITGPGQWAGNVLVASRLSVWGAEANTSLCLVRDERCEFTVLAGYRYLNLHESLNITSVSSDLTTNPDTVTFLNDCFNTSNRFYGGQVGARLSWQSTAFAVDVTPKLALGSTVEVVNIRGVSSQFGPAPPNGVFPGGFFTQPSNIGRFSAHHFTVIPSVELKLHLLFSPRCRAFIGYDFLYWNQVVRPGTEIDRNINLTQSAILGNTNGALAGPASPTPLINRGDFWAQGITLGFELRY